MNNKLQRSIQLDDFFDRKRNMRIIDLLKDPEYMQMPLDDRRYIMGRFDTLERERGIQSATEGTSLIGSLLSTLMLTKGLGKVLTEGAPAAGRGSMELWRSLGPRVPKSKITIR